MADLKWIFNRLKAMSLPEIMWRIQQKQLEGQERKRFNNAQIGVCDEVFSSKYGGLVFDLSAFGLNLENEDYSLNEEIDLLGFDYAKYKGRWLAGFQTENDWPLEFSYELEYKQRDEIGDARTNWELNRHFQLLLLAKNYYATRDKKYLKDFEDQFESWNQLNPFLTGINWTSTMEFAIRAINWMFILAFLRDDVPGKLKDQIATGTINMVDYVEKHRSRYSSANNHLLVEAAAIGIAGFAFNYTPWKETAMSILSEELYKQNYSDGINKELSLHYQVFGMEAYALMAYFLVNNGESIPDSWTLMLKRQCEYVSNCRGKHGEVVVFGDDDEGKILDLVGKGSNRYAFVLQFFGCLLDERFDPMEQIEETIKWLFSKEIIEESKKKPLYDNSHSVCYPEGGNSILKSRDGKILIGFDHAALGFGNIAAHGHADALSFQLFFEGEPVLIDPGTYIYHCNLPMRNQLRKTCNHNTVTINGKDQSQMLGAFLWGKKADCIYEGYEEDDDKKIVLTANHNGYAPIAHRRKIQYDNNNKLVLQDSIVSCSVGDEIEITFILNPSWELSVEGSFAVASTKNAAVHFEAKSDNPFVLAVETTLHSPSYGVIEATRKMVLRARAEKENLAFTTTIVVKDLKN